ncbi:hypothetical protein IC006_2324 [Sulfuracidifex tepidarius]|uniref:Uncharacterized protein n=1 Tax=Sulfuracidifex tepidarius TaxID=1294262 RepID=A0A510DYF1_9CREN|nr:hypothetical protein [Sulfuracidifex tepidarius]BBG24990.1 hypothetical protein IC006_2324 [Sulfuracidifex tepidarius]
MSVILQAIGYASGLSSVISTAALIATIYYYRKQTQLLQVQLDEIKSQSSVQECLQVRDSLIRIHDVLLPLMLDEIDEIASFKRKLNESCSDSIQCMVYVHNLFSSMKEGNLDSFLDNVNRLLRDLKSLQVERFKGSYELIGGIIRSICDSENGCRTVEELKKLKERYGGLNDSDLFEVDLPVMETVEKGEMKLNLMREDISKAFNAKELPNILDKLDFIVDCRCGDEQCNEKFEMSDLIEGKKNPLKEMLENPSFCKEKGIELCCEEMRTYLVSLGDVVKDNEKSRKLYSLIYLNYLANRTRNLINKIKIPSEVDLKIRLRAELERETCSKI